MTEAQCRLVVPAARAGSVLFVALVFACAGEPKDEMPPVERELAPLPAHEDQALDPAPSLTVPPPPSEGAGACPADMQLVAGKYCPAVLQKCLVRQDVGVVEKRPERLNCELYAEPTTCLRPDLVTELRFCMDRYEWPNEKGSLPRTLVTWNEAKALCESVGKRLCTEDEFTFACEGETMKPYVYGFSRDATKCNIDRPYRPRTFTFLPWDACQADQACKAAFDAIDQRRPAGSMPDCRSDYGVFDLNGNVNEWVDNPRGLEHRAGIKGGWWGPVRNRCRPTVTFHGYGDFGYEVGFRCCKDAAP